MATPENGYFDDRLHLPVCRIPNGCPALRKLISAVMRSASHASSTAAMSKKISADEYAQRSDLDTTTVVHRIMTGELNGDWENGQWVVWGHEIESLPETNTIEPKTTKRRPQQRRKETSRDVLVRWLAPHYDEVTLFSMGVSLILLFSISHEFRVFLEATFWPDDISGRVETIVMIPLFGWAYILGFILSLYHGLVYRNKSDSRKYFIIVFAVSFEAFVCFKAAGQYIYDAHGMALIFPAWNGLHAIFLLGLARWGIVRVGEKDASLIQVAVATLATLGVLMYGLYTVDYHWSIALSMAVALSSAIGEGVDRFVPA